MLGLVVTDVSFFESKHQVLLFRTPKCGCQRVNSAQSAVFEFKKKNSCSFFAGTCKFLFLHHSDRMDQETQGTINFALDVQGTCSFDSVVMFSFSCPFQLMFISALVGHTNAHPVPYVFRNYRPPPNVPCNYHGGCNFKVWQALSASCAAPGYFPEVTLNGRLHQVTSLFFFFFIIICTARGSFCFFFQVLRKSVCVCVFVCLYAIAFWY